MLFRSKPGTPCFVPPAGHVGLSGSSGSCYNNSFPLPFFSTALPPSGESSLRSLTSRRSGGIKTVELTPSAGGLGLAAGGFRGGSAAVG